MIQQKWVVYSDDEKDHWPSNLDVPQWVTKPYRQLSWTEKKAYQTNGEETAEALFKGYWEEKVSAMIRG